MRTIRSFAWLTILALPISSFGSIFQVFQLSEPAGFLSQTDAIHQGTNHPSVTPPLFSNGYAFGYWTIDDIRAAGPDGRSLTQVSSVIQATSTYKAYYFQESTDSDSDGIMDWFEYRMFGDLSRGPGDDPDGDGFSNRQEDQLAQDPLVKDLVRDGGLSSRTSAVFVYADTSMVKATIKSDPAGFVTKSENFIAVNSNVSTASLNGETNGYHFAYWSVNGVRQAAPNGTASSQVDLNASVTSEIIAHYLPSNEDSDSDGVMDWFELNQFGSLSLGPDDDPDGDGFSNKLEGELGQEARIKDWVRDGGLSSRTSTAFVYADTSMVQATIKSDPAGFVTRTENYLASGSNVSTASLNGETHGYHFAYWSVNGVRQTATNGTSASQVDMNLTAASQIVAHYLPSNEDSDSDGVMDWFEFHQFGNLSFGPNDDPDGDGFSNKREGELGQEARVKDLVRDGGLSSRVSPSILYFLQVNNPPDGLDLNDTIVHADKPAGELVGIFQPSDPDDPNGQNAYQLSFLDGNGSTDKNLFTISGRNLLSAASLQVGSYSLNLRVMDDENASFDKNFTIQAIHDPNKDDDNDGLTYAQEQALGTSDSNPDTDGDGATDKQEMDKSTSPLDANSYPPRDFVLEDKSSDWNSTDWQVYNGLFTFPQSNNTKPSILASQLDLQVIGNYPPGPSDYAQIAGNTSVTVTENITVRKIHFWSDANEIIVKGSLKVLEGFSTNKHSDRRIIVDGGYFETPNINGSISPVFLTVQNEGTAIFNGDLMCRGGRIKNLGGTIEVKQNVSGHGATLWETEAGHVKINGYLRQFRENSIYGGTSRIDVNGSFQGDGNYGLYFYASDGNGGVIVEDNASMFIRHGTGITSHDKDRDLTIRDNALFVTQFVDFTAKDLNGNTGSDNGKKCRVNLDGGTLRTGGVRLAAQSEFNWRSGTLEPGTLDGPQKLLFHGDLSASESNSTLLIELTDKSNFGHLELNGTLELGKGILEINLANLKETEPVIGSLMGIVSADQINGQFDAHKAGPEMTEVPSIQAMVLNSFFVEYNSSAINIHYKIAGSFVNSAPTDLNSTAPLTIAENQPIGAVVGGFHATDPDANATLTYTLVNGGASNDNNLFTLEANGTLKTTTIFDYESNASTYSIRVQVMDEHNASLDRNFTVTLTDLYEAPLNSAPTDLNSTAPLAIAENQPSGTIVGQFTAHDPDANATLSYRLANGPGSQHNNRFSLDANGTLRTAKVFDYENRTRFKIRVQVADEHNVSIQEAFSVSVIDLAESNSTTPDGNGTQVLPGDSNATNPDANGTRPGTPAADLFQPIVETREAKKVENDSATLRGSLVDNGGARITERGFLLSAKPNPKPGRKNVTRFDSNGSKNFQAQATELKPGKKYYYRAFATNALGTALGSVESFTTLAGPPSPSWINAQPGAAANWWTSRWFGNFYLNANGWARHEQLGWVFPMESPTAGLWLWKRDLGWLWTDKEIYPFLYHNAQGGWLYFYGQRKGTLLFYDYEAKRWISKEDSQ